jgi:hypothetical protein
MPVRTSGDLARFRQRVEALVHRHPVVVDNAYTRWFASGTADRDEVRHLTVQFSVFSHLFVEAQLRKVMNAADIDSYRSGKEILMNELGVVFRPAKSGAGVPARGSGVSPGEARGSGVSPGEARGSGVSPGEDAVDPDIVGTEGTVDGGRFRFTAAHFEWLLRFGAPLGLGFDDMGKRRHGTASTLFFCDELLRIYGSDDPSIAEGASYAVENWAAAGFWKELIAGLTAFKMRECPQLPLGFWIWHDKIEDQHAAHTADELAEAFFRPDFDERKFLAGAAEMLDGVKAFWDGLEADRLAYEERHVA